MECYMLGGRPYRSAATQPTFAQSGYLMGVVRTHGLDRVINDGGDLLAAIFTTGSASALLAGLLVEDGKAWSRVDALANATLFDGLTGEADHAQLMLALEALLAGFFPSGTGSSTPSATSAEAGSRRRKPRRKFAPKPESSAASGPISSPPSPSSTASA